MHTMAGAKRGRRTYRSGDVEIKVSGRHACRAQFERRPDSIIRVYVEEAVLDDYRDLLKFCAERRLAYHVVDAEELGRVSASRHHEGICLLAKKDAVTLEGLLEAPGRTVRLLALDGVDNPHNLGAILRTAAHYGVRGVIVEGQAGLPPAAHRVAEGGAAWVDVVGVRDLAAALSRAREAGFRIVGTAGRARRSLYGERFSARTLVVFGSEGQGMRAQVARACDAVISLPGTDAVESLNVSASTAVVLSEIWRQDAVR